MLLEPNICSTPICVTLHLPVPLPWFRWLSHSLFPVSAFVLMMWPLSDFFSASNDLGVFTVTDSFVASKFVICIKATSA